MGEAQKDRVRVFAPATVANVGSGFDTLGFALAEPGDILEIRLAEGAGIRILNHTPYDLPAEPEQNTAGRGVASLLRAAGKEEQGVEIRLVRKIPPGSGIGSSAASAVAAIAGINVLLGKPFSLDQLLPFCLSGEEAASLSRHADNVAPALLGGFCLVESHDPLRIVPLPVPEFLWCSVVHPGLTVKTSDARKVLGREVPLEGAIRQWARLGTLVAGLYAGRPEWIARGMEDTLIEPQRGLLISHFDEVKQAALEAGALNSTLSGAGPSVFALCQGEEAARQAGAAMKKAFERHGISASLYVSRPGAGGARIL